MLIGHMIEYLIENDIISGKIEKIYEDLKQEIEELENGK